MSAMFPRLSRVNVLASQARCMATVQGASLKHKRWAHKSTLGVSVHISLVVVVPQVPKSLCLIFLHVSDTLPAIVMLNMGGPSTVRGQQLRSSSTHRFFTGTGDP